MQVTKNSVAKASRVLPVLFYYATVLRRTLTYGELGKITGDHHRSFKPAFAVIHNWIKQSAEHHNFERLPLAIIVVQQGKSIPGAGAIKWRLAENGLSLDSKTEIIQALFAREQQRIFEFDYWATVLHDYKIEPYVPEIKPIASITQALVKRGFPRGESDAHRKLKEFVARNPTSIGLHKEAQFLGYEIVLPSLDRADLAFKHANTIYPIEVKSHEVDEIEFIRGIYQAIKYQCLFDAREKDAGSSSRVEARLVCGRPVSPAEALRCLLLGVPLFPNIRPV